MTRAEFEKLLASPDKKIVQAVQMGRDPSQADRFSAKAVITNNLGDEAIAHLTYNKRTKSKTINIVMPDIGPICRLDVDGARHKDRGRSHKHDLQTEDCPKKNLPLAVARPNLSGLTMIEVFERFCAEVGIEHAG